MELKDPVVVDPLGLNPQQNASSDLPNFELAPPAPLSKSIYSYASKSTQPHQPDHLAGTLHLLPPSSSLSSHGGAPTGNVATAQEFQPPPRPASHYSPIRPPNVSGFGRTPVSKAFSPGGKKPLSASLNKTGKLRDAGSRAALQTLVGHSDTVSAVAFSPDGKKLASASRDYLVMLWDAGSGEALQTLEGHSNVVSAVVFSPDGKQLASVSHKTVKLWDTGSGEELQTLKGHSDWVSAVAFSPDGKKLASASWDKTVKLWNTGSGEVLQTLEGHTLSVKGVAFSPNGQRLASASDDKTVRLWDVSLGAALQKRAGHSNVVSAVAYTSSQVERWSRPQTGQPFKCDQCPQSFIRNHDLKRHKRIHLAVKPFLCGTCDKRFSRTDALRRHRLGKGCCKASSGSDDGSSMPITRDTTRSPIDVAIPAASSVPTDQVMDSTRKHDGGDTDAIDCPRPLDASPIASTLLATDVLYSHTTKPHVLLAPSQNWPKQPSPMHSQSSGHDSDRSTTESTSSAFSDTGTTYDISVSVFSHSKNRIIQKLLSSFLVSLQDGDESNRSKQQTGNQGESNSCQPASNSQTANSDGKKRKRELASQGNREQDGDKDEDEEQRGPKKPKVSCNSNPEKLLACPFCKFNPHRYRGCYKYVLKDISRLKQHLSRCHRIPIHCALCSKVFDSEEERDEHWRELTCQKLPPVQWDGINEKQRKQLEQRVSAKMSLEENWYRIFEIIFPGHPRPKSPYVGQMLSADLLALQDFFCSEGVTVVREIVDRNLPPSLQPQEDEVQAFLEAAFQEAVGILLERWEAVNQGTRSPPALSRGPRQGSPGPSSEASSTLRRSNKDRSSTERVGDISTPLTELDDTQPEIQKQGPSDILDIEGFDWTMFIDTLYD